jgi:hypothetical protein
MAVGPVEGFVAVEEGLDGVFPARKLGETPKRIAEAGGVDDRLHAWSKAVNIQPEDKLSVGASGDLEARFGLFVRRNEEKQTSVERRLGTFSRKADPEPKLGGYGAGQTRQNCRRQDKEYCGPSRLRNVFHGRNLLV